jgi:hypothetical protein
VAHNIINSLHLLVKKLHELVKRIAHKGKQMIFTFNKKDSFLKSLYALCTIGRSDPENILIAQTINLILPYTSFEKEKYRQIQILYKLVQYQTILTKGFLGVKKKYIKMNWDIEIKEIENYLKILNDYITAKNYLLVKQMSYSMHNLPIAIYKNDKEYFEEIINNRLLELSLKSELMDSWKE